MKNLEIKIKIEKQNNLLNSNKELRNEILFELQNQKKNNILDKRNIQKESTTNNLNSNFPNEMNDNRVSQNFSQIKYNGKLPNNRYSYPLIPNNDNTKDNKLNKSDNNFFKENDNVKDIKYQSNAFKRSLSPSQITSNKTQVHSKNRHCRACDLKKKYILN